MKTFKILFAFATIFSLVNLTACKRDDDDTDDPHDHNEEELITTVELHFTNTTSGDHFMASWSDKDGDGGNDPTIDSIYLDTNSVYTVAVEFLDESGDHPHDLTHEIEEEASEHIVCFESGAGVLTIKRTDTDGTFEIGLASEWTTTNAAKSDLTLSLKHQPDLKDGTCAPGETDVEVVFPVVVQ